VIEGFGQSGSTGLNEERVIFNEIKEFTKYCFGPVDS
jgi:hypothetical protein